MNSRGKIAVLLFFFGICGVASMLNAWLQARRDLAVRPADLYAVVNHQLADLREANFSRAYETSSSSVQSRFNLHEFADAVRRAGIVDARQVEFGFVEVQGRRAIVQVFFIGRDGQVTPCIYWLLNENDSWKIDGARVMRRWPADARFGGVQS